MTDLIVCLANHKGALSHIKRVIEGEEWGNIYGFTVENDTSEFKFDKKINVIKLDGSRTISELSLDITTQLKGKIDDLEVAINIVAGSGKEHTALISSVISLGFGIRLVILTPEGVKTL